MIVIMIGFITGEVVAVREGFCIVSAGGVGYKVHIQNDALTTLHEGAHTALWIHTVVREDALDLYGFPTENAMLFFEMLLSVSGIGPRSALGILDLAPIDTLRSAIGSGNAEYLTSVSGIGKKTSGKIVVELRDKVGKMAGGAELLQDADALDAMRALGYSAQEARDALRMVPSHITASNDRLREALRLLGRGKTP